MNKWQKIGLLQLYKYLLDEDTENGFLFAFQRMASRCTEDECVEVMQVLGPLCDA